jgi:hypothetical protein
MPNPNTTRWFEEIAGNIDHTLNSVSQKLTDPREFCFAFGERHAALQEILARDPAMQAAVVSMLRIELEQFCIQLMFSLDGATAMSDHGMPISIRDRDGIDLSGTLASAFLEHIESDA